MKTEDENNELIKYATTLYDSNVPLEDIKNAMFRQGADEELASMIVQAVDKSQKKEKSKSGVNTMRVGVLLFLIGLFLTIISYANANEGETYSIYWKLMLGGMLCLTVGLGEYGISRTKRH
jgi:hypothetical protein